MPLPLRMRQKIVIVTLYNEKTKYHRVDKERPSQSSSSEMEVPRNSQGQVRKKRWKIRSVV